jgi:hypothetical protein
MSRTIHIKTLLILTAKKYPFSMKTEKGFFYPIILPV